MEFFERWFAVSPDDGSGALELVYAATGIVMAVAVAARRRLARIVHALLARSAQSQRRP